MITNTYSFAAGTSTSYSFDVVPIANGQTQVETSESWFQTTTMKAVEVDDCRAAGGGCCLNPIDAGNSVA